MNRDKFLQQALPFQGLHAPYSRGGHLLYSVDTPSGIVHSAFLVRLAMSDCESENPFQTLGLDQQMIFSINNGQAPMVQKAVSDMFDEFADRFRLLEVNTKSDVDDGRVGLTARARYLPFNQEITLGDLLPVDLVR
jgi:hypothetical protein